MSKYETTFVIDSLQKSDDMQNILSKVQNFIKNNGGEIGEVEDWGKRRLAYEINRKQYGNYFQIHFEGPSNLPGLLEREYRLEESVLRFLTIKTHPKAAMARERQAEKAKAPREGKAVSEAPTGKTEISEPEPPAEEKDAAGVTEAVEESKETASSTSDS